MAQGVLFVTDTSFFAIPTRVSVAEKSVDAVPAILSFHQTINNEPSTIGEKTTSKHIRILGSGLVWRKSQGKLVAAGFMPASKHNQRIILLELERGHKARGYELT